MEFQHIPVLYEEVLHGLALKEGGTYVDGTVGGGGHASGILSAIGANGRLLAIDQDTGALAAAKERLAPYDGQVTFFHANFVEMPSIIDAYAPLILAYLPHRLTTHSAASAICMTRLLI